MLIKSKRTREQNTVEAADKWLSLDGIPTLTELKRHVEALSNALDLIHKITCVRIGKRRLCCARKVLASMQEKQV